MSVFSTMITVTKEELQRLVAHRQTYLKLVTDIISFYNNNPIAKPLVAFGTPSEMLSAEKFYHYDSNSTSFTLRLSSNPPSQPKEVYVEHLLLQNVEPPTYSLQCRNDSGYVGSSATLSRFDDDSMSQSLHSEQAFQIESDCDYAPSTSCDSELSIDKPCISTVERIDWNETQISIKNAILNAFEIQLGPQTIMSRFQLLHSVILQIPIAPENDLNPQIIRLKKLMKSVLGTVKYSSSLTAATYFLFFLETSKTHALYPTLSLKGLYRKIIGNEDRGLTISYLMTAYARGRRISEFCKNIGFDNEVAITAIPLMWGKIYRTQSSVAEWTTAWIDLNTTDIFAHRFVGLSR